MHFRKNENSFKASVLFTNAILLLLLIIPLICYDGMKWSFHAPRYLILQLFIFVLLGLHLLRAKTSVQISILDVTVGALILFITTHSLLMGGGGDLFNRVDILLYLGLFYLLIQFIDFKDYKGAYLGFIEHSFLLFSTTGLLLAAYGILQFYGLEPFRAEPYPAAESKVIATMGNANGLGGYLATLFPFLIYRLVFFPTRKQKAFALASIIAVFWALALTLSRGAWIALIGGMLVLFFPKLNAIRAKYFTKMIQQFVFLFGAITLALLFAWGAYLINPGSAIGRLFVWKISLNMIADHPMLGLGYGRYGTEYLNYQARFFDSPQNAKYFDWADNLKGAKNEYLQIAAETGIIGVILFLALLSILFYASFRMLQHVQNNNKEKWSQFALISSVSIILFHSLVDNPFYDVSTTLIFWFVLGLISLKAKEAGILTLTRNDHTPKKTRFSFSHNWGLRLLGLILLIYNSIVVIEKAKGYVRWQNGQSLAARGNWQAGVREYEKALKVFPNDGELQFHLGAAYAYCKQPERALELLELAHRRFNDKNLYIAKGYALIQLGRFAEAESSFRASLRMYPKLLLPRLWLAELYRKQDRTEDSLVELREILEIQPKVVTEETRSIKQDAKRKLLEIQGMYK